MTAAQQAQQNNRHSDGRYAENNLADPGTDIGLPGAVECLRHGGPWGDDETCSHCCDPEGTPYPVGQPGEPNDDEKDLALMRRAQEAQWGTVTVKEGARTPWGPADVVNHPAAGIARVHTAGHGGYKLSPERNRAVPAGMRNSSGWYEEDDEGYVVSWVHPDAVPHWLNGDPAAIRAESEKRIIDHYPDAWEKATGNKLQLGQSELRDTEEWAGLNAGQPCILDQRAAEHPDYPGLVVVNTGITGDPHRASRHMIPIADYTVAESYSRYGKARVNPLLPASAIPVPDVPTQPAPKPAPVTGISLQSTSATMVGRANADLDRRWRDSTGRLFTMRDDIAAGRFCGKTAHRDNGKNVYYLRNTSDPSVLTPVSKVLWDVYQAEDDRTPATHAYNSWQVATERLNRALSSYSPPSRMRERREQLAKLRSEVTELEAAYRDLAKTEADTARPSRKAAEAEQFRLDRLALDQAYMMAISKGLA